MGADLFIRLLASALTILLAASLLGHATIDNRLGQRVAAVVAAGCALVALVGALGLIWTAAL